MRGNTKLVFKSTISYFRKQSRINLAVSKYQNERNLIMNLVKIRTVEKYIKQKMRIVTNRFL